MANTQKSYVDANGVTMHEYQFLTVEGLIVTVWAENYKEAVAKMRA